MNVLSLFDGMSCGQQALERSGIHIDNYFASEIDKYAIKVTMANYPNTQQLGSVIDVDGYSLPKIDLLLGGSPCQSFSFAGKRKGMSTKDEEEILTLEHYLELKSEGFEFEGQSYLFWEYMRLLKEVKPKYFLLENVMMGEKWEKILSKAIGVNPIEINSSLLSAQNRRRLYWTNIGMIPSGLFGDLESVIQQPKDKGILLKDVIEKEVDNKYFLSSKIISGFERHKNRHEAKGTGFGFKPKNGSEKGNCLRANASLCPTDNMILTPTNILNNGKTIGNEIQKAHTLMARDYKGFNTYGSNGVVVNKINLLILDCYNNNFRNDGKVGTITQHMSRSGMTNGFKAIIDSRIRRLTPVECETLQTVKDNYTNQVSDTQRYKMLGNGWTVDVISHILNYIK
jgi:DNA (cytosine-5)-methyltransferase 1